MKIEVSADKPIADSTIDLVVSTVESGLSRFGTRLTRAEVYLKNIGSAGARQSIECALEVRPAGRDPVVVRDESPSLEDAVGGAVGKMERLLDSTFGKLDSPRGGPSASGLPT